VAVIKYTDNFRALENSRSPWVPPGTRWTAWQAFVDHQLAALGRPYRIAGVAWFQGIDDGYIGRDRTAYTADLRAIVAGVRSKFGAVPFVLARSVDSRLVGPARMAPIRAGQVEVGADPGNAWIDVDDLPTVNVHHLTAAAQRVVGQRYGEAFMQLACDAALTTAASASPPRVPSPPPAGRRQDGAPCSGPPHPPA
jgi:hypothetical protein